MQIYFENGRLKHFSFILSEIRCICSPGQQNCAKIACIYFEFFWRSKKRICFVIKELLKESKSAIFYLKLLGFSN